MLEARALTFAYKGAPPVIDGVSLAVAPGERLRIAGPSGRGKTTLCRLLAGYEAPDAGQVLADGAPLPRRGRCPVQMVGQHPEQMLDPRIPVGASLAEAAAAAPELLGALGIRETWLGRFPRELSGGELQRFCIARALLARPRYLVADEISTMLDAVTQARLWRVILEAADRQSMGLVLTTHSDALAQRLATRTVDLGERAEAACGGARRPGRDASAV